MAETPAPPFASGDALAGQTATTLRPGLVEPPDIFTFDRQRSRESIRRLAELEPSTMLFGHGPPLTSAAEALSRLARSLPS
jgi:hydroxyacylglutathione hydrolase